MIEVDLLEEVFVLYDLNVDYTSYWCVWIQGIILCFSLSSKLALYAGKEVIVCGLSVDILAKHYDI
jgi:hypothetical protein